MTKFPANSGKPVLLVDVDGVISLFGFESNARPPGTWLNVDGIVHFLSADAARHLLALAEHYDLVWCTGWEEKANDYLRPALGLPTPLPFLTFGAPAFAPTIGKQEAGGGGQQPGAGPHGEHAGHWKLPAVAAFLGPDRPAAWVDDTFTADCFEWARRRSGPTLLVPTDPPTGLAAQHAQRLADWSKALAKS